MAACADFPAVNSFLQMSLVLQSNLSADESSVGPKMQRGQNGERGLLVVAENPVMTDTDTGGCRRSFETFDEMHARCQEDDDSAAEDVQECRINSFPEAKQAPYYVRLRIGLDTRDSLPPISPSGISSSTDDNNANSSNKQGHNTMPPRPTNQHKMTYFVGVDHVVPFSLLGRDDDGNNLFAFQKEDSLTVNHPLRDHVASLQRECTAIVVDDRDHTGTFWNVVGEILLSSVRECAAKKGIVKVFVMATPAVTMVGANTLSKLYDLSKLPEDDSPERDKDAGGMSSSGDAAPPRRTAVHPQPEPTIQYAPGRDEYGLSGVGAVDLLVPPELDPDEPPSDEVPEATVARKKEHVATLLYHWIKTHRQAMADEGSAHVVMIVQRIPDCDAPDDVRLSVVVGLFDETRSKLVKADAQKNKPGPGAASCFSVWSKEQKEGEHHSQRLTSATASVSSLVHDLIKIVSRGPGARKEMQSSEVRQLIRSHVVTRLLKGSLCTPQSRLAWVCCARKGQEMHVGHHTEPYSNESNRLKSFAVPPGSYFMYVRLMDALASINKYRIRKVPPMVRPAAPSSVRSTPRVGGRTTAFESPRTGAVQRGYFHTNAKAPAAALKRFIILKKKTQDLEVQNRSKMLREERASRGKIDRLYLQFRLKEFAQHRRKAIESKRVEIKKNIDQANQDRRRRLVIRQRRQYTPPGLRGPRQWDPSPAEPLVNRKRAKTPPPVPKRAIRVPARVYTKVKAPAAAAAETSATPWAVPQLPSGKGPQKRVPVKPPSGRPPPGSRGRPPPASAFAPDIKKHEMDEFMKRTMVEQEWGRGVRSVINSVFDDEEDVADRLLLIQKGGVPPPQAASPLRSVTSSESFPHRASSKNLSDKRVGSGQHSARREPTSASRDRKGSLPPAKVLVSPGPPREASISPTSSRSSGTSSVEGSSRPLAGNASEQPRTPPRSPVKAAQSPTRNATASPSPTVSRSSSASSRASTRSSYKSSRSSSRSESVASNRSAPDQPAKARDAEEAAVEGPMVPIPVESAGAFQSVQEQEEYYQRRGPSKTTSEAQLSARSDTVRALNGSTAVTKIVRTTSAIEPLHSEAMASGRVADSGDIEGPSESYIEDVSDTRSTGTTPEEEETRKGAVTAAQQRPSSSHSMDAQQVPPNRELSTISGVELAAASQNPPPPEDEDYASDSDHEEEEVLAQGNAVAVEADDADAADGPKILTTTPSRKRFQSADFNDLTTFDYGPEVAAPVQEKKPFADDEHLAIGDGGRRASEASTVVGADGARRRSSIGHLLGNNSDDELDVLDL